MIHPDLTALRDVLDGRDDVDGGNRRLAAAYPAVPFSNGFLWAEPGHMYRRARSADAQIGTSAAP